jgi:ABC-2 type transport system ATP-binding protein
MDHGKIIAIGSPAELVTSLGAGQIIEIEPDRELDIDHLAHLPGVREARYRLGRYALTIEDLTAALPLLVADLSQRQVSIRSLTSHEATLEDVFIHMTGKALRDD